MSFLASNFIHCAPASPCGTPFFVDTEDGLMKQPMRRLQAEYIAWEQAQLTREMMFAGEIPSAGSEGEMWRSGPVASDAEPVTEPVEGFPSASEADARSDRVEEGGSGVPEGVVAAEERDAGEFHEDEDDGYLADVSMDDAYRPLRARRKVVASCSDMSLDDKAEVELGDDAAASADYFWDSHYFCVRANSGPTKPQFDWLPSSQSCGNFGASPEIRSVGWRMVEDVQEPQVPAAGTFYPGPCTAYSAVDSRDEHLNQSSVDGSSKFDPDCREPSPTLPPILEDDEPIEEPEDDVPAEEAEADEPEPEPVFDMRNHQYQPPQYWRSRYGVGRRSAPPALDTVPEEDERPADDASHEADYSNIAKDGGARRAADFLMEAALDAEWVFVEPAIPAWVPDTLDGEGYMVVDIVARRLAKSRRKGSRKGVTGDKPPAKRTFWGRLRSSAAH